MSTLRAEPGWADVLIDNAAEPATADRLIRQLNAASVASLAFCRLLERWGRGDAAPSTPGGRQAALRRAADRAETALAGLERPLGRYLLELEPERAEGRSWYGAPRRGRADRVGAGAAPRGRALLVGPGCSGVSRAGRLPACPGRARRRGPDSGSAPDRSSLWAGLFDLRENLLGRASTTCAPLPPETYCRRSVNSGPGRSQRALPRVGET
jgi:hypothetical protein